ncbi:DUF2269 family protein [Streptomyces flaveolus]|uniref:DUF2269 family protein n=1 Tax=Streptomyces flaveolus TaxID=67297 RepID=UPI0033B5D2CC
MTKFLLSVHVLAAILAVGPITVAASMFPRYAQRSASRSEDGEGTAAGVAEVLHRICRGYAVFGIAVPVFGFATAAQLGVLTDAWLIVSIFLTALAAAVLALAVLPRQQRVLAAAGGNTAAGTQAPQVTRLHMVTGIFNLIWAVVVVLMIVRPGSTTGA